MRVTEQQTSANLTSRINGHRNQLSVLQERLATGKRINRASDDPSGAAIAFNLKTSLTEIAQFQRNTEAADQKLTATDDTLNSYQTILERVRTLVTQGLSDTATQEAKNALATEIESLRGRILNVANSKNGDEYLFGGTRQNQPPFDQTTAVPAVAPTAGQFVQLEPGTNAVAVGATADAIFSDSTATIFQDLDAAVSALRGTANPAADRATLENSISRLNTYKNLAQTAQAETGATMKITEFAKDRLINDSLSFETRLNAVESADFAETAVDISETQRALEATLQTAAANRRSLLDFLG